MVIRITKNYEQIFMNFLPQVCLSTYKPLNFGDPDSGWLIG